MLGGDEARVLRRLQRDVDAQTRRGGRGRGGVGVGGGRVGDDGDDGDGRLLEGGGGDAGDGREPRRELGEEAELRVGRRAGELVELGDADDDEVEVGGARREL